MSYVCDSCSTEISSTTESNECPECGQRYLFDPTEADDTDSSSQADAASQGTVGGSEESQSSDRDTEDVEQRQQDLNSSAEESGGRVLWEGGEA